MIAITQEEIDKIKGVLHSATLTSEMGQSMTTLVFHGDQDKVLKALETIKYKWDGLPSIMNLEIEIPTP